MLRYAPRGPRRAYEAHVRSCRPKSPGLAPRRLQPRFATHHFPLNGMPFAYMDMLTFYTKTLTILQRQIEAYLGSFVSKGMKEEKMEESEEKNGKTRKQE